MTEQDPIRFADDGSEAPEALRDALREARSDVPDGARLDAIWTGLGPLLGPGGPGGPGAGGAGGAGGSGGAGGGAAGTGAAAAAAGATTVSGTKIVVTVLGVVLVLGGGTALVSRRVAEDRVAREAAAAAVDAGVPLDEDGGPPDGGPPDAGARDAGPLDAGQAARAASAAPPAPQRTNGEPPSEPEPATAPDPADELRLLEQAQDALATAPREALARVTEHQRLFPESDLTQEREVLAIDALLRLGRRPDAEARAARFRARYPRSSQVRRIDALLAR